MTRSDAEKALAERMYARFKELVQDYGCDWPDLPAEAARIACDAIEKACAAAHGKAVEIIYQLITVNAKWEDHNDTLGMSTHAAAVQAWDQACGRKPLPIPWSAVAGEEGGE